MAKYLKKYKTREDFEEKKESLRYDSRIFENVVCWLEDPDEIEIISRDDRHIFIKYILKSKVMTGKEAFFSSTPKFKEISINGEIFTDPKHLTERDWEAGEYFVIITPMADFEFNGWFKDNKNIIEILYSNQCGVTNIERNTFDWCTNLSSVTIPEKVISIGDYAFYGCSSLASITIPESVTSIGNIAFRNCTSLTSINIPESVTSIGNTVFGNCSSLTSINIPESVTWIGSYAFENCNRLTSITCFAITAPKIDYRTFRNIATGGVLKYPQGSDYSSWMSTSSYYLGYYNWTSQEMEL